MGQRHALDAQLLVGPEVHGGRGGTGTNPDLGAAGIVDLDLDQAFHQGQVDLLRVLSPAREADAPDELERALPAAEFGQLRHLEQALVQGKGATDGPLRQRPG
ncbi:hypothetical protein [Methylobacterium sp. Leaf89]|uniref:hypothetical protein n=1 Tax=Methylobacterium sp. Leaf89 TaxID=1736245 RepID=UPI001FCD706A|nr:hypothetical protein [Methylobacterium sp. Leaf89]